MRLVGPSESQLGSLVLKTSGDDLLFERHIDKLAVLYLCGLLTLYSMKKQLNPIMCGPESSHISSFSLCLLLHLQCPAVTQSSGVLHGSNVDYSLEAACL